MARNMHRYEELTPYLLNKQKIPADKILDLIRPHLRSK